MINNFVQIPCRYVITRSCKNFSNYTRGYVYFCNDWFCINYNIWICCGYYAIFKSLVSKKIVRYAIFFAIAKLYIPFTDNIVKAIFSVGYLFFPGGKRGGGKVGLPDLMKFLNFLMGSIKRIVSDWQLLKWHELSAHFTYLIMVIIGICVLLIIKEIIVNFVELK